MTDPVSADAKLRNRLLAGLTLVALLILIIALPFALREGERFFLPLTIAIVLSIALVPFQEWQERQNIPSGIAAVVCVIGFVALAFGTLAVIIIPAVDWFSGIQDRIPKAISNLEPIIDIYSNFERFIDDTIRLVVTEPMEKAQSVSIIASGSIIGVVAATAPAVLIETFYVLLAMFFFLAGWRHFREGAITGRASFDGAMTTARVLKQVVSATSSYIATITVINLLLGLAVGLVLWALGMDSPIMWGGIVALLNFIPYVGPVLAAFLLALGGLMTFDTLSLALIPALVQIGFHTVEANLITPYVLGRRLTMNPLLILVSLSFWSWIWGVPGALLAVPLLIIIQTVSAASGRPDITGFLFEEGHLLHPGEEPPPAADDPAKPA